MFTKQDHLRILMDQTAVYCKVFMNLHGHTKINMVQSSDLSNEVCILVKFNRTLTLTAVELFQLALQTVDQKDEKIEALFAEKVEMGYLVEGIEGIFNGWTDQILADYNPIFCNEINEFLQKYWSLSF